MTSDLDPEVILAWMRRSFNVDADRGSIVWRSPPSNHPRLLGLPAGSGRKNKSGKEYIHIKRDGVALKRSWLIFLWSNGRWPKECVDHIDGNSLNDRLENLREATVTQNSWNHTHRKRRINLPMGVRLLRGSGRFQARIACNKKMFHLGAFDTPAEARAAYLAKRKELYGEFA